ncbi:hypothetical protein ACJRO7_026115 [Eucalyptus globulus]|uniref:BTB domain-containing protein n=1 Tax=Eucalyptus globulus TaxID=34317 RepID=A0ABD3KBN9_EUCGL
MLKGSGRKVEVLGPHRSSFLCETKEKEEGREMAIPPQMHRSCEEKETDWKPCKSCEKKHVTVGAATRDLPEKAEQNMPLEDLKRQVEVLGRKVEMLEKPPAPHPHPPPPPPPPPQSGSSHDPGFANMVLMIAAEDGPNGGPSMPLLVDRDILVSQSPVFKAMLENEMEESQSGTIKISDMSYDALHAFVNFLRAEACVDEQMACELLVSAEKYLVEQLKAYCEMFLVSKLNWDNLIKYFAFAHQHNAKHLLDAATSVISDNLDKLRKRQEYSLLFEVDPRLGLELLEASLLRWENNDVAKASLSRRENNDAAKQCST